MADVNTTILVNTKHSTDLVRPHTNFPTSVWGNRFLSYSLDNLKLEKYSNATKELQEELRMLIVDPTMEPNAKLSLINCVYRLGMKYLFIEEISCELDQLFDELNLESYDETDLYTTSVHFQVFRQHGYKMSSDVFNKFKDSSSGQFMKYITNDVKAMLSLFEATQLRIRGESILDEALVFTEAQLKSRVDALDGNLGQQVRHALRSPFHRGLPMVEARLYFSNYQEECSMYDPLLKLANAHFNYLQLLQKEDLRKITQWSKDMEFQVITPYARDRIPDLYLWGLGLFYEPHYSEARLITTKMAQLVCVLDDTYDAYATFEELQLLTDAINSWEISAMENLPDYMKPLYKIFIDEHTQLENQLSIEGERAVFMLQKKRYDFQELAKGYLKEAEWRHSGKVPSFQEYLKNGLVTSTYNVFAKSPLMGLGETVAKEALAWYESCPKILEAIGLSGRLYNDVTTFQFERQRGQQQVTSIDAYMKTFGVSENVAVDELMKMIDNAWKDINEGGLKPTAVSLQTLAPIVNLARMTDVIYRYNDRFTFPEKTIEDYITILFIDPI